MALQKLPEIKRSWDEPDSILLLTHKEQCTNLVKVNNIGKDIPRIRMELPCETQRYCLTHSTFSELLLHLSLDHFGVDVHKENTAIIGECSFCGQRHICWDGMAITCARGHLFPRHGAAGWRIVSTIPFNETHNKIVTMSKDSRVTALECKHAKDITVNTDK